MLRIKKKKRFYQKNRRYLSIVYAYVNQFTCKKRKSGKNKKKMTLLLNNFIISMEGTAKIDILKIYYILRMHTIILIYSDILYQRRNIIFERQGVRELWSTNDKRFLRKILYFRCYSNFISMLQVFENQHFLWNEKLDKSYTLKFNL